MTVIKNVLELTVDESKQMAYIRVKDGKVSRSTSLYDNLVVVDFDETEEMVGFEILSLARFVSYAQKHDKVMKDPICNFLPSLVRRQLEALA